MIDNIFGELLQDDCDDWHGKQMLDFGGSTYNVDILINNDDEEEKITAKQKEAFKCFMEKWPKLQDGLIEALIEYYNEEERFSYGPDDEEESEEWWPEIETREDLLQAVTLETIVVPDDFMMEDGRCIYLLFSRIWGGEDLDDNGIGVCYIDEEISEIAYKDIAY